MSAQVHVAPGQAERQGHCTRRLCALASPAAPQPGTDQAQLQPAPWKLGSGSSGPQEKAASGRCLRASVKYTCQKCSSVMYLLAGGRDDKTTQHKEREVEGVASRNGCSSPGASAGAGTQRASACSCPPQPRHAGVLSHKPRGSLGAEHKAQLVDFVERLHHQGGVPHLQGTAAGSSGPDGVTRSARRCRHCPATSCSRFRCSAAPATG